LTRAQRGVHAACFKLSVALLAGLSVAMGLWLLEQVTKGGLEEEKRRSVSNSLGRLLLPMIDSLGNKLAELEHG